MPYAVLRSLTGMISSSAAVNRRRRASTSHGASHGASAASAAERLEDRCLFALAVAPVPTGTAATTLAAALLVPNTGITITGGTYVGQTNQGGTFSGFDMTGANNVRLNIQNGVLLTTGLASDALGPNNLPNTATQFASAGDPDLNVLTGLTTFDANALTLNFTTAPGTQSILFDFIFGSEEFSEFLNSPFNDSFAAYLDGVQVSFDINSRPITVNNNFFRVDNLTGAFAELEYDGLTPRIRTTAPLNPAITSHTIKFVIADTFDQDYDSAVFLGRLQGGTTQVSAPTTDLPNPGTIVFSSATYAVDETAGVASILVSRVGGTSGQVSVNYTVTAGTATDLVDFVSSVGILTFADGQTSQAIAVPIVEDALSEGDETVQLTLSGAVDAGLGTPNTATLSISDNEAAISFTAITHTIDETAGVANLAVSRSGEVTGPASINYVTGPGSAIGATDATASADFITSSGTVNFAAGQRTANIAIPIVADFDDTESALESFAVTLSAPTGGALGVQSTTTIIIVNADRPPSIYDITAFAPNGRIEALYLKMNDPVWAGRAIDPANYDLYQHTERRFNGPPSRKRVKISAVDYNPGLQTLVVHPAQPLKNNVFYEVTVRGTTENGLLGSALNEGLDGNFDRFATFGGEDFVGYFGRGTRLQYNDRDGDKVKLGTTGRGVIEVFRDVSRDVRTVRYLNAGPSSAVFGSIPSSWSGADRMVDIGTLILGGAENHLPNPPFRIGAVI